MLEYNSEYDIQYKLDSLNISEEKKEKLIRLRRKSIEEYQLKKIKEQIISPTIGDIFRLVTVDGIELIGIVLDEHFPMDHVLILVFKEDAVLTEILEIGIKKEDLLIHPVFVSKKWWREGYFYNESHIDQEIKIEDYGFVIYDFNDTPCVFSKDFYNQYCEKLSGSPKIIGVLEYTMNVGIAERIQKALIIDGRI